MLTWAIKLERPGNGDRSGASAPTSEGREVPLADSPCGIRLRMLGTFAPRRPSGGRHATDRLGPRVGAPIAAQPAPSEFHAFACGSNGGPPRAPVSGWADLKRCPPEADGLHEVYFEYDDEMNTSPAPMTTIARSLAGRRRDRISGDPSALFDDAGILRGIRLVTDPRPDHRDDITEADRRKREEAYLFGGIMASRFVIEPNGTACRCRRRKARARSARSSSSSLRAQ